MATQTNFFSEEKIRDKLSSEPEIKGKQYIEVPGLQKLADRVREDRDLEFGPAEIGYQLVYPNVSKKTAGRCKRCSGELQFYSGYHYLIQMSGELWDMLSPESQYALMWHELMHVHPSYNTKTQEWKFRLRDHDFEDFYELNDVYGLQWIKQIKAEASALYDMSPQEEDEVSL